MSTEFTMPLNLDDTDDAQPEATPTPTQSQQPAASKPTTQPTTPAISTTTPTTPQPQLAITRATFANLDEATAAHEHFLSICGWKRMPGLAWWIWASEFNWVFGTAGSVDNSNATGVPTPTRMEDSDEAYYPYDQWRADMMKGSDERWMIDGDGDLVEKDADGVGGSEREGDVEDVEDDGDVDALDDDDDTLDDELDGDVTSDDNGDGSGYVAVGSDESGDVDNSSNVDANASDATSDDQPVECDTSTTDGDADPYEPTYSPHQYQTYEQQLLAELSAAELERQEASTQLDMAKEQLKEAKDWAKSCTMRVERLVAKLAEATRGAVQPGMSAVVALHTRAGNFPERAQHDGHVDSQPGDGNPTPTNATHATHTPNATLITEDGYRSQSSISILTGIKGLGKKKLDEITTLLPTLGHIEDLRAQASSEHKQFKEVLPKGCGDNVAQSVEDAADEVVLKWSIAYMKQEQALKEQAAGVGVVEEVVEVKAMQPTPITAPTQSQPIVESQPVDMQPVDVVATQPTQPVEVVTPAAIPAAVTSTTRAKSIVDSLDDL